MDDPIIAPDAAQVEFNAMLKPILEALPDEPSGELLANIIGAICTEFIQEKDDLQGALNFALRLSFAELDRFKSEQNRRRN